MTFVVFINRKEFIKTIMSYLNQKTIKNTVLISGVGLHSGLNVNVKIKPAGPNSGIVFKRIDLRENNIVYPSFMNVTNTS